MGGDIEKESVGPDAPAYNSRASMPAYNSRAGPNLIKLGREGKQPESML